MSVQTAAHPQLVPISVRPPTPSEPQLAAVYRLYGADGELLYIGSTDYPPIRWSQHRTSKAWWTDVAAYSITWWPDRMQAFTEEYKAIHAENPWHNRLRRSPAVPAAGSRVSESLVQRVFDALDDVERIDDPEARSRAQAQITAETRTRAAKWAAERGELARRMDAEGESLRGIARRLGIKPATVQDLLRGYKGSGKDRPSAGEREAGE
ncbi:hypothetical protein K4B79_18780 [Streptomyces lincolnensis]|uniref:GIY-YIG nuclease family protein n=1 Tax=Streptomyces lincolnensis TaxID=1915 RepID=UPI001E49BC0F|nr:GIY-YIG nuclease family protein [Streptomyces lincolnensis]MCD7440261.1 hypothetical protein [Streptomyces lincolnensis]